MIRSTIASQAASAVRALSVWASGPGLLRTTLRPLSTQMRQALVRAGDPTVSYLVGRFEIELPLSHELPRYRSIHPLYDTALGRLAKLLALAYPDRSVIDVGANVGDTAATIRTESAAPLLCIEGSKAFFPLLERNAALLGRDVFLEHTLIGPERASISGMVQVQRGTAAVVPDDSGAVLQMEPLEDVVRRHPTLPQPKLLKIDTDGYDCPIVEGSVELWRRAQPVLFFEFDPDFYPGWDPRPMFEALKAIGYERALVYENTGEYAGSVPLSDLTLVDELHQRYRGWNHERYADLCLFHAVDRALGEQFRIEELRTARRSSGI